jgi:hypothetical protein
MGEPEWNAHREEDMLERARWVVELRRKGWTFREIARHASLQQARRLYPTASEEELEIRASRRGIAVSEPNLSQYEKAWLDVEAGGLVPDPATIWLSYNLAFRGPGARERRLEIARQTRQLPVEQRRDYFLRQGRKLMDG